MVRASSTKIEMMNMTVTIIIASIDITNVDAAEEEEATEVIKAITINNKTMVLAAPKATWINNNNGSINNK